MATKDKLVNLEDLKAVYDHGTELLEEKADKVGSYPDLIAGTADNLLASSYQTDRTPYIFRRTPYGAREKGSIVGGSIVWNQRTPNGNFESTTGWVGRLSALSASGNVLTLTPSSDGTSRGFYSNRGANNPLIGVGHKYLLSTEVLSPIASGISLSFQGATGSVSTPQAVANQWTPCATIWTSTNATIRENYYTLVQANLTTSQEVKFRNHMTHDLTLMFGPTVADYIYTQEQATEGAGVALAKAWAGIKGYVPYDPGSIKSVTGLTAHKMTGYNQLPVAPAFKTYTDILDKSNAVFCLPNVPYYFGFSKIVGATSWRLCIKAWDEDENMIADTFPATVNFGNLFTWVSAQNIWRNGSNNTTKRWGFTFNRPCWVQFSFGDGDTASTNTMEEATFNFSSSHNGQYEPYTVHTYPLDSSLTLRGLPKLDGDSIYYDGDVYPPSGEVERRYGVVDLGTLNWSKDNQTNDPGRFYSSGIASLVRRPTASAQYGAFILCSKYIAGRNPISTPKDADKMVAVYTNGTIYISDITYTENTAAEFKAAMSGVYLLYETAEPATEQAEPYMELQACDPAGTEEWVGASMPVGHDTQYYEDLKGKIEDIPDAPSADGTYTLRVTVSGGVATYSWE